VTCSDTSNDRDQSMARLSFVVSRMRVHSILTIRPIRANWMVLTFARVWSGHSRVTPGRFPRVSSSYDMRLRSRIIDSVRDETIRGRRPTRERYPLPANERTSLELKSFRRRNNLPCSPSTVVRSGGEKDASGQPLLRPEYDWPSPEGSDCRLENSSRCIFRRGTAKCNEYRAPVLR